MPFASRFILHPSPDRFPCSRGSAGSSRHPGGLIVAALLGCLTALTPSARGAGAARTVFVREFDFVGNTVFTTEQLRAVVAADAGHRLTDARIEQARIQVSRFYIDHGYTNSGALLKGVDVHAGIVYFQVIEGKVTAINVSGNRWFSGSFIRSTLRHDATVPYNANAMAGSISDLLSDGLNGSILALNADLRSSDQPGEGVLNVEVKDRQPFHASVVYDNRRPAGVGEQEVSIDAQDVNLTGYNDVLEFDYVLARETHGGYGFSGANNLAASYTRPLSPYGTTLTLRYSRADFSVIEEPFQDLDIHSNEIVYSGMLRQTVLGRKNLELAVALQVDHEHSFTSLMGMPFTLSAGEIDGTANLTVFRFIQELNVQKDAAVLAVRSTFSVGTTLFDGAQEGSDRDADFFSWRGEAQLVLRLLNTDNLLVLRANGQITPNELLELEQYSVGGRFSVRGYRENELVRDGGYFTSAELRLPLLKGKDREPIIQLAPFADLGGGYNNDAPTPKPKFLASVGVGLLITYKPYLPLAEFYYGYGLKDAPESGTNGDRYLQDSGIHFFVQAAAF